MPSIAANTSMQGKAISEVSRRPPFCHISRLTIANSEASITATAPLRRPARTSSSATAIAARPTNSGGRLRQRWAQMSGMAVAQIAMQVAQMAWTRRRSRNGRAMPWPGDIGCSLGTFTGSNLFDVVASISIARAEGSGRRWRSARLSSGLHACQVLHA